MMTWKPLHFESTFSLDSPLHVQLDQFLYEKEGMLGECIVYAIHIVHDTTASTKPAFRMKLSEALEKFEKRIVQLAITPKNHPTIRDFQKTLSLINDCLWEYVETLESCVIELFQQLDQLGLEKWHKDKSSGVDSIKMMLFHRLEDVSWAIRRMEKLFWQYYTICSQGTNLWSKLKNWLPWSHFLDSELLDNLEKSKKYLGFRYKKFIDRMNDYNHFMNQILADILNLQNYQVYKTLDSNDQENFKRLYELLKLWALNQVSQSLPGQDIAWAIQRIQSEEKNFQVFNDYYHALKDILFHQARLFKLGPSGLWKESSGKTLALEVIKGHRHEIQILSSTLLKYDHFLRTHSKQGRRFLDLPHEVLALESLYEKLYHSLEKGSMGDEENKRSEISKQIDHWLHTSSHPLASRSIMHTNIARIIDALAHLDELGSFQREIMDFVGNILSRTLRIDWKYNVAFEIYKFREVYQIHMGLLGRSEDRQHFNRLKKFKQIFQQIEDWATKKITQTHIHEIEQDMSDIKVQLQDFLAFIQRIIVTLQPNPEKLDEVRKEIANQLLEYRYQFGKFLHHLTVINPKEQALRNHFLFVFQYFEAIENKLYER